MAKFCTNCGTQIDESTRFCPNCGAAIVAPAPAQQNVTQYTAPVYGGACLGRKRRGEAGYPRAGIFRPD